MLDSLLIKNFRSLENFEVSKLGHVNLIVGKNNSGKSSVLEALRIYAGNAQRLLLESIARGHDERYRILDGEQFDTDSLLPFQDFFTGRCFPTDGNTAIEIGSLSSPASRLTIKHALLEEWGEEVDIADEGSVTRTRRRILSKGQAVNTEMELQQVFVIKVGERTLPIMKLLMNGSRARSLLYDSMPTQPCSFIPTQFISMDELADEWDDIALTGQDIVVKNALRIIAPEFENLNFVRAEGSINSALRQPAMRQRLDRTAMVKLAGLDRPVPLNSLGDGMLRMLQLALKIFSAKGGFLLIDEFENGLHYSVQEKIWTLLFEMSKKLDIQVFATTHSWDCIESFSKVAIERKDINGVLFRMGKSVRTSDQGRVIATVFDEVALHNITQTDVEVR